MEWTLHQRVCILKSAWARALEGTVFKGGGLACFPLRGFAGGGDVRVVFAAGRVFWLIFCGGEEALVEGVVRGDRRMRRRMSIAKV